MWFFFLSQMVSQTQPCPPSHSQSLLADAEASRRLCSRRRLLYSNKKSASSIDQGAAEDGCAAETDLNRGESLKTAEPLMFLKYPTMFSFLLHQPWQLKYQHHSREETYNRPVADIKSNCWDTHKFENLPYSQEQKEAEMKVITGTKSGKGKKEVLSWRCQTCHRLRRSTLRLHPAAQSLSPWLWTHPRFVSMISNFSYIWLICCFFGK